MKNSLIWLVDLKPIDSYPLYRDSFSNHIKFSVEAFY